VVIHNLIELKPPFKFQRQWRNSGLDNAHDNAHIICGLWGISIL
jgi:hypothetical protein